MHWEVTTMKHKLKKAFDCVQADDALQAQTLAFVRQKAQRKPTGRVLRLAAAVACLVLVLGGCGVYLTPTAHVDIDVNPSVQLGINCFDTVVSARGLNADGEELVGALDLRFRSCREAVEELLSCRRVTEALADNGVLEISVAAGKGAQNQRLMDQMADCAAQHPSADCHAVGNEEAASAREAGLSCAKYRLWTQLQQQGSDMTAAQAGELSVQELRQMLNVENGESYGQQGHHGQHGHHGNG